MKRIYLMGSLAMALSLSLFSCTDENSDPSGDDFKPMESDGKYVGEAVGNFSKEEWYPGGELGTTDNVASGCYEDESPAVTAQGLLDDFNAGEKFFERQFTSANSGFKGLGPASVRRSCLDCHPNYGHGRRMDSYTTSYGNGNGYLLRIDDLSIYIAGDTEPIDEMSNLGKVDVAFLPVNQPYTMNAEQCIQAARIIKPRVLFPYHYGDTDLQPVVSTLSAEGIDVRVRQLQ